MKEYVVINKQTRQIFGRFDTLNQASVSLAKYVTTTNKNLLSDDVNFISIFDFEVKEEEKQKITSYEEACKFLGLTNSSYTLTDSPKNYIALKALSKLFTIAEAWNKEDGFVPDFSNEEQQKYFPWFDYNKSTADFVCTTTTWTFVTGGANVGFRLCFATRERALAFGKLFQDLYNDFLLM